MESLAQCVSQRLLTAAPPPGASPSAGCALTAAAADVQASWAAHAAALAAAARQADAASPIAAAAARVAGLANVARACRAAVATLASAAGGAATTADLSAAVDAADAELGSLAALLADEAAAAVGGRFEWVDGALTRAIERGGWVLLEGSNLCNPTVLDRLNPLLEPGGCLYLNECGHDADGNPRLIRPHPDFRLLLALDPRHGEVSRAMRNRGIEIFLLPPAPPAAEAKAAGRKEEPAQEQAQRGLEEVVDADVEAVVRSAGVACKRLLRALARAHRGVAALCARGHKRSPGLREAATAASLAAALLARGWAAPAAVRTGWTHVYLRGQGYSAAEAATAQGLLEQLLAEAYGGAGSSSQGVGGGGSKPAAAAGDMDWEPAAGAADGADKTAGERLAITGADGTEAAEAGVVLALGESDGTLSGERAAAALEAQALVPAALESSMLAAPAAWPVAATVQRLAGSSSAAGAERDASLLSYLLGAAAAAALAGARRTAAQAAALRRCLQAALRSGDGAVRSAAAALLCYLPAEGVVAPVLLGTGGEGGVQEVEMVDASVAGGGGDEEGAASPVSPSSLHLLQLVWATAQCLAFRASQLDAQLRSLAAAAAEAQLMAAAAALAAPGGGAGGAASAELDAVLQLAALAAQAVGGLVSHPAAAAAAQAAAAAGTGAGMPAELQQLQPLDVRYSHLLQPYLPGMPAADWDAARARGARLRSAAAAHAAALLLRHVTAGADVAVGRGVASPLQHSYWRFLRPEERCVCLPPAHC
mgnify:CR=1 FL=1